MIKHIWPNLLSSLLFCWATFANCPDISKVYGPEWIQSFVEVPLEWDNPESELIKVAYYHKDQSLFINKTPIVFFNGGPTMAGHTSIKLLSNKPSLKDENMIYIDQRGTGCSGQFPKYSEKTKNDFRHFTSQSIVKDAEVVRKQIHGDKKWRIFGQSYGGLISMRYIEQSPESIESAHIHGFGVAENAQHLFEAREKSILRFTDEILDFKHLKSSPYSVRELMNRLIDKPNFLNSCFDVPGALKSKFCGPDIFTSLFMMTGFKDVWPRVVHYLALFDKNIDTPEILYKEMKKFVDIYLLRFNNINQAAALNVISYIELSPGKLFYDSCLDENAIISECRFKKNFLPRLKSKPSVEISPIDLEKVAQNIKHLEVDVHYYAGKYDTFLPEELLVKTASKLGIEDRLHIFENSGHEGFYTEAYVIERLKNPSFGKLNCAQAVLSFL